MSNVEFYLLRDRTFERFVDNVRALPRSPESVFIRACFDYGREHPPSCPGTAARRCCSACRFLVEQDTRPYVSDWDLCTRDYLRSD